MTDSSSTSSAEPAGFDPQPRGADLRPAAWVAIGLATCAVLGGAGFLAGTRSGEDLGAARADGAALGQRQGDRAGAAAGYADGVAKGEAEVYRRSYDEAYRAAYTKVFEQAGVKPPARITVYGE